MPDTPETLAAKMLEAAARAPAEAKLILDKTLADIVTDAQQLVPVDTGYLRGSISWDSEQDPDGAHGQAGPTATYGRYVEEGTSRMPGRPYMEPAFRRREPLMEAALRQLSERTL